jgi:hypothetical protein
MTLISPFGERTTPPPGAWRWRSRAADHDSQALIAAARTRQWAREASARSAAPRPVEPATAEQEDEEQDEQEG